MGLTSVPSSLPAPWAEWSGLTALTIFERLQEQGFAGRDPYDALNATRFRSAVDHSTVSRRLAVQVVKHSPLPLQPLLGVPRAVSAYTLGHAMIACARLHKAGLVPDAATLAAWLVVTARDVATDKYGGLAWGSHFDVETRFAHHPRTLPNIVVTAYVAKGLVALAEAHLAEVPDTLEHAATFILEGLPRLSNPSGRLICYTPETRTPIHNASLLAAGALSDMSVLLGRPDLALEAESAALYTVSEQRDDGSWPYAEDTRGQWIDNFHTGFVLEGLARVTSVVRNPDIEDALDRGMAFYRGRFFGEDGRPYYSATRRYPLDALSAAQSIETLAVTLSRDEDNLDTLRRVLGWLDTAMVRADGRVAYRVWSHWTDWRQFPRWSLAPLASALAGLAGSASESAVATPAVGALSTEAAPASDRGSNRRLLMVVHSEYPIGEPRVRRQAEAAAAAGWHVVVLALATQGVPSVEESGGVTVCRTRVRRERRMTMRGLLSEYGRFFAATFNHCRHTPRYDVIVVANPPDFLVLAPLAQKRRGARVVLDVHDLMTDVFAVRLDVGRSDSKYKLLSWTERFCLKYADHVMTVHRPYAEEITRRTRGRVAPVVVMNSADDALFPRRQEVPSGSCLFFYHGSLFERYGVLDLVRAFVATRRQVSGARLWLAGDGDCRGDLLREAQRQGLGQDAWISDGMLPAEEISSLLLQAHVGVVPNQPNELNKYALSTKLFEYVATGVPVVCSGLPTLRAHFAEDELLFYEPGSVDDLADKLVWAAQHPEEMCGRAERASAHYDAEYSWPRQKAVFLQLLESSLR